MEQVYDLKRLRIALALLRITLGLIILVTWFENLTKDLYTADGLAGFLNWLADPNGNGGKLVIYHDILDATVIPVAGVFATFQLITELAIGLGLLAGGFTRLLGLAAMLFFLNLFLAYIGGHEWIWTYVLLFMTTLAVTLGAAGRTWGIDSWIRRKQRLSKIVSIIT